MYNRDEVYIDQDGSKMKEKGLLIAEARRKK